MLQLFGHPFSSYTWKALIPLYAHELPFTFRMLGPEHAENQAAVRQRTPAGKFPLLLDGGKAVFEATGIIEYLAATRPECRTLLPADPAAAAYMRMLDRVFDNYVTANMQRVVQAHLAAPASPDQAEIAAARQALARAYHWLETWLEAEVSPGASRFSPAPPRRRCSTPTGYCQSRRKAARVSQPGVARCSRSLWSRAASTMPAPTASCSRPARRIVTDERRLHMPTYETSPIEVTAFAWVPPLARGFVRDLRVRWALEEAGLDRNLNGASLAQLG